MLMRGLELALEITNAEVSREFPTGCIGPSGLG
jgi:hypothetical protein